MSVKRQRLLLVAALVASICLIGALLSTSPGSIAKYQNKQRPNANELYEMKLVCDSYDEKFLGAYAQRVENGVVKLWNIECSSRSIVFTMN